MNSPYILINGQKQATVSALDRGLNYGHGVFETIALINKQPQLWSEHYQRLKKGCERLNINSPTIELLESELTQLISLPSSQEAKYALKIIVTAGSNSGRGYSYTNNQDSNRILILYPWPNFPEQHKQGIQVRFCQHRLSFNPNLAGIKHLNRLEQILARNEWQDDKIAEGLMLDYDSNVISGTMSNLFLIKEGFLMTPAVDKCGVAGIMREFILQQALQNSIPYQITTISQKELMSADEIFISNSLIGIWPVTQIENKHFQLGPITNLLKTFNGR